MSGGPASTTTMVASKLSPKNRVLRIVYASARKDECQLALLTGLANIFQNSRPSAPPAALRVGILFERERSVHLCPSRKFPGAFCEVPSSGLQMAATLPHVYLQVFFLQQHWCGGNLGIQHRQHR